MKKCPNSRNISKKEYNSWQETNYLLKSKTNQKALAHSISQLGDSTKHHLLTPKEFKKLVGGS